MINNSPIIKIIEPITLVGVKIQTSLSENRTTELWRKFGPLRKAIKNQSSSNSFSVEIYDFELEMKDFTPSTRFEKWAAIEVFKLEDVPNELETLIISGGKYAVFTFKGLHSSYSEFADYIFTKWLPSTDYKLDNRPHFEIMRDKYLGPMNPNSEEELWIPIQ